MQFLNKKTIGGAVMGVLVLLLFFSKTIYTHDLPTVTAILPHNGKLVGQERATGVAGWAQVEKLYAAVGGVVEEVLAEEGDRVREGQELFRLRFDRDEAERKLRELQNRRSGLYLGIQELNLRLEKVKRYMENLEEEEIEQEEISDYELSRLNMEIRLARMKLQDARERHDDGDISDVELEEYRKALQSLYLELEKAEKELEVKEKAAEKAAEKGEKDKDTGLKDHQADIDSLNLDIQAKNLELAALSIDEEPYKKALEEFNACAVITAPADGTVISLDAGKGETVRDAQLMASMSVGNEFQIDCIVPVENSFIKTGDDCELSNSSGKRAGMVTKITPVEQGKSVRVSLESDEVTAGETFELLFKKESDASYILVPNGALNKDGDGYFLWQVKRRDGIMGSEYYLDRLGVYIGDSDADNTAVVQGIGFFEPVTVLSDKPVEAGGTVLLSNEGDFFES